MPKKPVAILSDIHGNLEALVTVLANIERQGVKEIYCLGDTVGYGASPRECVEIAMKKFAFTLMGNHEYALLKGAKNFNPVARSAIRWCREEITDASQLDFLKNLRPGRLDGRTLFVHASVKNPLQDYVREIEDRESFEKLVNTIEDEFQRFDICFVGHNHKAFLGTRDGLIYPHDEFRRFQIQDNKLYICVGSVGQPRDRDARSCYVLFDGESVEYHRVAYDIDKTAERIIAAGLPEFLAERLYSGM